MMKVRNKNDNADYVNHLKAAMCQIDLAIDSVTYVSHPELNKQLIAKLMEINSLLDTCTRIGIFKP
jgi:hypothetical protein